MTGRNGNDATAVSRRRLLRAGTLAGALQLAGCSAFDSDSSDNEDDTEPIVGVRPDAADDPVVQSRLEALSLREKAGQMVLLALNGSVRAVEVQSLLRDPGVGGVLYGAADPGSFDPRTIAERMNGDQRRSLEETAHGLPHVAGIDAVHGNATNEDAVVFPHNLGMGATWQPELVGQRAAVTSRSLRATGFQWNFAPVADILYDPRWGRFYEGFHEFPSAVSAFVEAGIEGLESSEWDVPDTVAASIKHFAGYSMVDGGIDRGNAEISERDLRETVFPPFEDGFADGGETVMVNSGAVNGTPAHVSSWLLRSVVREDLGFEGVVVSDWGDIWKLSDVHDYLDDGEFAEGVKLVVNAGVDMYMASRYPVQFIDAVVDHVENGEISETRVDHAVARILQLKQNLGLFDDPLVDVDAAPERVVETTDHELAREAADESMTLLENDGVLPIDSAETILVTGPNADDPVSQHGGWTLGWQRLSASATPPTTSVLEGIRKYAPDDATVEHVPTGRRSFGNRTAVANAAARADITIAVLGEGAYAEGQGDIQDLSLPSGQQALLSTLDDARPPTVSVLVAGRPRGGDHLFESSDAVLMAYYPGSKGGAVGRTLFGERNPGGRLPFTWPRSTDDLPVAATIRGGVPASGRRYPVGHGETYTEFQIRDPVANPAELDPTDMDQILIEYEVENVGARAGAHLARAVGERVELDSALEPWPRLSNWQWVSLGPGEQQSVTVDVPVERLAVFDDSENRSGDWLIPAGEVVFELLDDQVSVTITETVSRG